MKLKGDLDNIGLAELFKTLSSQRATGILSVTSSMGEKLVALSRGEVAVFSDRLAERTKLGDLLVARGHLTEQQLTDALKLQRTTEQRAKLGDLLVKNNLIKPDAITDALRFQLEEEIFDLFTWQGATFEFEGDKEVGGDSTSDDNNVHRLSIDPQVLIAEAAKRMTDWAAIAQRLPTPYLCFKLTAKGDEGMTKANATVQRILRLLKEGRTVETTVKKSCLGRFNVCKGIIKLLDESWIFPYPSGELRLLASEHRAQKRFPDALNIYRRLMESAEDDKEREDLQTLIDDTIDAIHRSSEAGESPEGAEIVSYKAAANRYKRKQLVRKLAFGAAAVMGLGVAAYFAFDMFRPPQSMPENYMNTLRAAESAINVGDYEHAIRLWQGFYDGMRDKQSNTALRVQERLTNLPFKYNIFIETQVEAAETLEKVNPKEAEVAYGELMKKYPNSDFVPRLEKGLERIRTKQTEVKTVDDLQIWKDKISEAQTLLDQKKWLVARKRFQSIIEEAPDKPEIRGKAVAGLASIKQEEDDGKVALEAALKELNARHGEKAIELFDRVVQRWPDFESAEVARRQGQELRIRLEQALAELERAKKAEQTGKPIEAKSAFQDIDLHYNVFELSEEARAGLVRLGGQLNEFDRIIKDAMDGYLRDPKAGRKQLAAVLLNNPTMVTARDLEIPIRVDSQPQHAKVTLDGKELPGTTPLTVKVPAGRPYTLVFDRVGYAAQTKNVTRLTENDLETFARLEREPVLVFGPLKNPVLSPPQPIDGGMLFFHGTSAVAVVPPGRQELWHVDNVFSDAANTRPNPSGTGAPVAVFERSTWHMREAPLRVDSKTFVLTLLTRDVVRFTTTAPSAKRIIELPEEPSGRPGFEPTSLLGLKSLIAVPSVDGRMRVYDLAVEKPVKPLWEKPIDPNPSARRSPMVGGVSPRKNKDFVGVTAAGKIAAFASHDGGEQWQFDLKASLSPPENYARSVMPASPDENIALLITTEGKLICFDLNEKRVTRVIEVTNPGRDEIANVMLDATALYVVTRDDTLRKYPRIGDQIAAESQWRKALDGNATMPLVRKGNVLYCVTQAGHIYASNVDTGESIWDYRMVAGVPSQFAVGGEFVYIPLTDGKIVVLNAE